MIEKKRIINIERIILILILLGALAIRLPFLDIYRFEHEMVRDIAHGERILNGELILRGVYGSLDENSSQQSFGPIMYYLIAGSLLLAPNTYWYALMPSIVVMVLNMIAVILCFIFGKEFFNKAIGIIAAALFAFSPWFVLHVSTYSSTPNYLPVLILAFMYCLAKVIIQRKDKFILPCFLALGIATQFHLSTLMLFPFLISIIVIWRRDLFRNAKFYKALGITAILYIPYVFYILKTGSYNSLFAFATARYPSTLPMVVLESIGIPFMYVTPYVSSYLLGSVKIMPWLVNTTTVIIVLAMGYAVIYTAYRFIKNTEKEKILGLLLLWWFIPVIIYMLVGKNVSPHFFVIILPAQFLVAAYVLYEMYTNYKKQVITGIIIVLAVYILFILKFYIVIDQNGGTNGIFGIPYKYRVEVVKAIAEETSNPTIVYYGNDKRNMNYLFKAFGLTPTYKYIEHLEEFKTGYLIFDDYDFYSYHDKALSKSEKEKVKKEPGTEIKHIKILRQ